MKINERDYKALVSKLFEKRNYQVLFEQDFTAYYMMSFFSGFLYEKIKYLDIEERTIQKAVASVIAYHYNSNPFDETLKEVMDDALIIFSFEIWEELEKYTKKVEKD